MSNGQRIFTYCFAFGRVIMIPAAATTHEHRPLLRTREQAACLIRLGALVRRGSGSPATWTEVDPVIPRCYECGMSKQDTMDGANALGIDDDQMCCEVSIFQYLDSHPDHDKAQRRAESGYAQ